jgi:predicted hydrocarbon binding protein
MPAGSELEARYYYPNRMGRILLHAHEDVLGHNVLHALLKMADFSQYAQIQPPNNTDRQFGFEVVGGMTQAMIDMYGPRGARGVSIRVGRVCFKYGIREYGPMMGVAELTFQLLPLSIKLEKGASAFAELFNRHTDQRVRLEQTPDVMYWHIDRNPLCWGVETEQPCCHLAVGLLQESLMWLSGGKTFHVEETTCKASGGETCTIAIEKKPLD